MKCVCVCRNCVEIVVSTKIRSVALCSNQSIQKLTSKNDFKKKTIYKIFIIISKTEGIGSIMGSSANLVAMAVSKRYSKIESCHDEYAHEKKSDSDDESKSSKAESIANSDGTLVFYDKDKNIIEAKDFHPGILLFDKDRNIVDMNGKVLRQELLGNDFLLYGFPVMVALIAICTLWQQVEY